MTEAKGLKEVWRTLAVLVALAVVLPAIIPGLLNEGVAAKGGDWKSVTVLYTTDIKGKIEPCG